MGRSVSAYLFYGIDLLDRMPEFLEPYDGDLGKYLCNQAGIPKWSVDFEQNYGYSYFDKEGQLERECPVEFVFHGEIDYPFYAIAVQGTIIRDWEDEKDIPAHVKDLVQEKINAFYKWLDDHNIEYQPNQAKWIMRGSWG